MSLYEISLTSFMVVNNTVFNLVLLFTSVIHCAVKWFGQITKLGNTVRYFESVASVCGRRITYWALLSLAGSYPILAIFPRDLPTRGQSAQLSCPFPSHQPKWLLRKIINTTRFFSLIRYRTVRFEMSHVVHELVRRHCSVILQVKQQITARFDPRHQMTKIEFWTRNNQY